MTALLELQAVRCRRGRRTLFQAIDCRLAPGQLLWVGGDNGAGKTSLLRSICGLLTPLSGQVLWRGQPIQRLRDEFARELLFIGHGAALKDDLSALENLLYGARVQGLCLAPEEAREALKRAGLATRMALPSRVLSQGQRRRACLARLELASEQLLWVLDEPFNALDTAAVAWLSALICARVHSGGLVVLTSHQPLALPVATQTLVLGA